MSQQAQHYLAGTEQDRRTLEQSEREYMEPIVARSLSDKASLLRPLQDQHLLEVYREAKRMNLSAEFIELLEEAIAMRKLDHLKEA
jgi:hypothetical protein